MKLRCEREALLEALTTAGRAAVARGSSQTVLSGLRLEVDGQKLSVTGTDQDLTISVQVDVTGMEAGVAIAPARLITDIVRALDAGAVVLDTDDEDLRISSGRSLFSVRTHPVGDFPHLPTPSGAIVTLPANGLAEALRQVVRAASNEEQRPILTGVLMASESSGLRMVSTDSYRLAVRDLRGAGVLAEDETVLVPSRALGELQRLLGPGEGSEVSLRLGFREVTFSVGTVTLTSRLIEGEFPNYRQLIPHDYPNRLKVGREVLLDALRRVKLLAKDPSTPVRIALHPDSIELTVVTADLGSAVEDLDAKYEGMEMTVAFNPAYLIDGVEAISTDEVVLDAMDALKPATLRPSEGDDYLYLLMPVRVP